LYPVLCVCTFECACVCDGVRHVGVSAAGGKKKKRMSAVVLKNFIKDKLTSSKDKRKQMARSTLILSFLFLSFSLYECTSPSCSFLLSLIGVHVHTHSLTEHTHTHTHTHTHAHTHSTHSHTLTHNKYTQIYLHTHTHAHSHSHFFLGA